MSGVKESNFLFHADKNPLQLSADKKKKKASLKLVCNDKPFPFLFNKATVIWPFHSRPSKLIYSAAVSWHMHVVLHTLWLTFGII